MAKAKAAPKKTTAEDTSMQKWDAEMAKYAQQSTEMQKQAVGGGNFIQTRGGLSYKKEPIPGDTFDAVVLESIFENDYYEGDFDPDNPRPPACFAFGRVVADMKPHPDSVSPQHTQCKGCPHNAMGTAERGKGKRCKNVQRHALITSDALEGNIETAEVAYLKTPVTSGQEFAKYSLSVNKNMNRPLFGVVTTISRKAHPKYQFQILMEMKETINDGAVFGHLVKKHEEQVEAIAFPYLPPSEEDAAPATPSKARKFAKGNKR